jgi:hypothetical protein
VGGFRFSARCLDEGGGSANLGLKVEDLLSDGTVRGNIGVIEHNVQSSGENSAMATNRFLSLEPDATLLDETEVSEGNVVLGMSSPSRTLSATLWFEVFDYTPGDDCTLDGTVSVAR